MRHKSLCDALVFAVAASLAAPAVADEAPTSGACRLDPKGSSIALDGASSDQVSIPVTLNGTVIPLVIDTDGTIGTLSWATVEQLHLKPRPGPRRSGGDINHPEFYAVVQNFAFGASSSHDKIFHITQSYFGAAGTIAPDFESFDVEIDLARRRMNVFAPSTCIEGPYWANSGAAVVPLETAPSHLIRFPMLLDGKRVIATIDTRSPDSRIRTDALTTVFGITSGFPHFKTLATEDGSIAIQNPHLAVASGTPKDTDYSPPDVFLGLETLQHFRIYIAYRARKLFLTAASSPLRPNVSPAVSQGGASNEPHDKGK